MRKVVFYIDDVQYFHKKFEQYGAEINELFDEQESFKVIYTLYGTGKNIDRYELTDYDGNKVQRDTLKGYQKGVVLNDCMAYFTGGKYHSNGTEPCGVIKIEDSLEP